MLVSQLAALSALASLQSILSPLLRRSAQKKIFSKCYWSLTTHLAILEFCWRYTNAINVAFMSDNPAFTLLPMNQSELTFKSCYLRNTFYKPVAAISSDLSDGSGYRRLNTLWKKFTIHVLLRAFMIYGRRGEISISGILWFDSNAERQL